MSSPPPVPLLTFPDLLVLVEWCQEKGPSIIRVYPSKLRTPFLDPDRREYRDFLSIFANRIFSCDRDTLQYRSEGCSGWTTFSDSSTYLTDTSLPYYSYIHRITLHDLNARGYVRPICLCYLTMSDSKLIQHFPSFINCFTLISKILKWGNNVAFVNDLRELLKYIRFTEVDKLRIEYRILGKRFSKQRELEAETETPRGDAGDDATGSQSQTENETVGEVEGHDGKDDGDEETEAEIDPQFDVDYDDLMAHLTRIQGLFGQFMDAENGVFRQDIFNELKRRIFDPFYVLNETEEQEHARLPTAGSLEDESHDRLDHARRPLKQFSSRSDRLSTMFGSTFLDLFLGELNSPAVANSLLISQIRGVLSQIHKNTDFGHLRSIQSVVGPIFETQNMPLWRKVHLLFSREASVVELESNDLDVLRGSPLASDMFIGQSLVMDFSLDESVRRLVRFAGGASDGPEPAPVLELDVNETEGEIVVRPEPPSPDEPPPPLEVPERPFSPDLIALPRDREDFLVENDDLMERINGTYIPTIFNSSRNTNPYGEKVVQFMGKYSFAKDLAYNLLRGRTVVVVGRRKDQVESIVNTLGVFVPGHSWGEALFQEGLEEAHLLADPVEDEEEEGGETADVDDGIDLNPRKKLRSSRKGGTIRTWCSTPLNSCDILRHDVIGLSDRVPLHRHLMAYCTVFDVDNELFIGLEYQKGILDRVFAPEKLWSHDHTFLAFLHSVFLDLGIKASLFYHLYHLDKELSTRTLGARNGRQKRQRAQRSQRSASLGPLRRPVHRRTEDDGYVDDDVLSASARTSMTPLPRRRGFMRFFFGEPSADDAEFDSICRTLEVESVCDLEILEHLSLIVRNQQARAYSRVLEERNPGSGAHLMEGMLLLDFASTKQWVRIPNSYRM